MAPRRFPLPAPLRRALRFGRLFTLLATGALLLALPQGAAQAAPMSLQEYMVLDGPEPSLTLSYGGGDSQKVEVFLPAGEGPFPVAVLIHGGCWSLEYGGLRQMHDIAGGLAAQGIAVWNVEYRRVDEAGGGYPGTYLDVAHAVDLLAEQAAALHLDTRRVVAIGHSAGGELAQWLAGRSRLPQGSPLFAPQFLPIREVIGLGSLADLRAERRLLRKTCARSQTELTGLATTDRPDPFVDTNPLDLLPNGSHTVLFHGSRDHQVPPPVGRRAAQRLRAAGDQAEVVVLPGASHFDEVAFHRPAWQQILPRVRIALGLSPLP